MGRKGRIHGIARKIPKLGHLSLERGKEPNKGERTRSSGEQMKWRNENKTGTKPHRGSTKRS